MAKNNPVTGVQSAAKAKRRKTPHVIELVLTPGMLPWLTDQARRLNHALGSRVVTPSHIAHQVLREALELHYVELYKNQLAANKALGENKNQ